jgi:hypothetical protein
MRAVLSADAVTTRLPSQARAERKAAERQAFAEKLAKRPPSNQSNVPRSKKRQNAHRGPLN